MGGAQQILKRIPKIKFPDRRRPASGKGQSGPIPTGVLSNGAGSASIQPKRVPLSKEEMEVITMGGR